MRSNKFQNYFGNCVSQILSAQLPAGSYRPSDVNVTQVLIISPAVAATAKTTAIPAVMGLKYVITKRNANPTNIIRVIGNVNFFSRRQLSAFDSLIAKKFPGTSVGIPTIRDISPPNATIGNSYLTAGGIAGIVIAGCVVIVLIVLLSIFIPKMRNAMHSQNHAEHKLQLQNLGSAQVYEVRV